MAGKSMAENYKKCLRYRQILIIIALAGVAGQFGAFDGYFSIYMLNYFTVLSNIAVIAYFIADVRWMKKDGGESAAWTVYRPLLKSCITAWILVTFTVALFVLRMKFDFTSGVGVSFLAVHFIVPAMTIADWYMYDKKGIIRGSWPVKWYLGLAAYAVYAISTARLREDSDFGSAYIYPFLDVDQNGWSSVILMAAGLTGGFFLLSYLFILLDTRIAQKEEQRQS